jgi:hypothetical protein
MDEKLKLKMKELIQPEGVKPMLPEAEVTLEQLESLCYGFSARPRGCSPTFTSVNDNDDVLF